MSVRESDRLLIEQGAIDLSNAAERALPDNVVALTSIAISLKRIADLLESLVEQRRGEDQ